MALFSFLLARDATDHGSAADTFIVMTKLQFKGSWNEAKGKLKQKYGQLSDNDLAFADGKDDELLGRAPTKTREIEGRLAKRNREPVDRRDRSFIFINTLLELGGKRARGVRNRFSGFMLRQKEPLKRLQTWFGATHLAEARR